MASNHTEHSLFQFIIDDSHSTGLPVLVFWPECYHVSFMQCISISVLTLTPTGALSNVLLTKEDFIQKEMNSTFEKYHKMIGY